MVHDINTSTTTTHRKHLQSINYSKERFAFWLGLMVLDSRRLYCGEGADFFRVKTLRMDVRDRGQRDIPITEVQVCIP